MRPLNDKKPSICILTALGFSARRKQTRQGRVHEVHNRWRASLQHSRKFKCAEYNGTQSNHCVRLLFTFSANLCAGSRCGWQWKLCNYWWATGWYGKACCKRQLQWQLWQRLWPRCVRRKTAGTWRTDFIKLHQKPRGVIRPSARNATRHSRATRSTWSAVAWSQSIKRPTISLLQRFRRKITSSAPSN